MARGGIYKSEVLRARDKLVAMGRYPSIDAIRTELGDTGSKATIHRYLKEIEEEEGGGVGKKVAASEAIQDLVARLAARLHEEADTRIAEGVARHVALAQQQSDAAAGLRKEAEAFRLELERTQQALADEQARHRETAETLRRETLTRTQLAQQVSDLQDRVAVGEQHRQSLEDKHQHARDALKHFRQSAKEQREQELRQHEQQVQYLQGELRAVNRTLATKQEEVVRHQQESHRSTTELARTQSDLQQARSELRALTQVKEQVASTEQRADEIGRRLVEQQALVDRLTERNATVEQHATELRDRAQALEIELATARAASMTHDQLIADIRAQFDVAKPVETTEAAKGSGTKPQRRAQAKGQNPESKSAT
ncbi:MAG: DNA-binding protein [Dechloromonas sp.]|nr:DNA-binding protein [Dechloromonas sp.]